MGKKLINSSLGNTLCHKGQLLKVKKAQSVTNSRYITKPAFEKVKKESSD